MNDNVTFSADTYGTASPKWGYSKNEKKPTSMMTREELLKAGIIKPATKPMDDSRPGKWYAGRIVSLGDRRVCPQCRRWFDTAELCHKLCPECLSQRNARNYAKNAEERRRRNKEIDTKRQENGK